MSDLMTRAHAEEQGYAIDDHGPGRPIAFKGRRFAPTAVVGLFTKHEEELRSALRLIASGDASDPQAVAFRVLAQVPTT